MEKTPNQNKPNNNKNQPQMKVLKKGNQGSQPSSKNTKEANKDYKTAYASVKSYEVTRGKKVGKVSKFKRWVIETLWGLKIQEAYHYEVLIHYYKGRIHPKDIVVSKEGVIFYTLMESNRVAKLVTYNALTERPVIEGQVQINRPIQKQQK